MDSHRFFCEKGGSSHHLPLWRPNLEMVSASLKEPGTWDYLTTELSLIFRDSGLEIRRVSNVPRWTLTYEKGFRQAWLLPMSLCHRTLGPSRTEFFLQSQLEPGNHCPGAELNLSKEAGVC